MTDLKKYFIMIIILSVSQYSLFANISEEAQAFLKEIDIKNNESYSGSRLVRPSEAKVIIKNIESSNALTDKEKMYLKIEAYSLWAATSITSGTFEEDYIILKDIYKNIRKSKAFWNGQLNSNIYSSFSDFGNSLIPLAMFNDDAYWFLIAMDASEYSRLALLKNPNNKRASALYAISNTMTVFYMHNNQYSKSLTFFENAENGLPEYMVFRTYIYKSMMYMRINETQKAFDELAKAEKMYPDGMFVHMLKSSYAKGESGFASAKGSDFDSIANFDNEG